MALRMKQKQEDSSDSTLQTKHTHTDTRVTQCRKTFTGNALEDIFISIDFIISLRLCTGEKRQPFRGDRKIETSRLCEALIFGCRTPETRASLLHTDTYQNKRSYLTCMYPSSIHTDTHTLHGRQTHTSYTNTSKLWCLTKLEHTVGPCEFWLLNFLFRKGF